MKTESERGRRKPRKKGRRARKLQFFMRFDRTTKFLGKFTLSLMIFKLRNCLKIEVRGQVREKTEREENDDFRFNDFRTW